MGSIPSSYAALAVVVTRLDQHHGDSLAQSKIAAPPIDIAILTIRDDEFLAVLKAFPEDAGHFRARREYALRYGAAGKGQRYTVAIVRQVEQGNGEAQDAARDIIDDLAPSLLLVVGIAGGLPSDDFTLGDVVVATRVNDYSVEARTLGESPLYTMAGGPVAKSVQAGIANLLARRELRGWSAGLAKRPKVSWNENGLLYGPAQWRDKVRKKLELHFGRRAKPRAPTFVSGPIASSDRLVKNPRLLFPWIQTTKSLLAVEMESAGAYRAARERCPMVAIRGISDIVGLKRAEAWTKFACQSAASFTKAYLKTTPVPPKDARRAGASSASGPASGSGRSPLREAPPEPNLLYANLLPLTGMPESIFVAPALNSDARAIVSELRASAGENQPIPRAWVLFEKTIYSFDNPAKNLLAGAIDVHGVEKHDTEEIAHSTNLKIRRVFVQLLNRTLRDDLRPIGLRHFLDDDVFAFVGAPDRPPWKVTYQNVKRLSTMKVVSHYPQTASDGAAFVVLRHLAFSCRFRYFDNRWFVEVEPTYRFTTDGKGKYAKHEQWLSKIKRLEGNRSVLSQLLVISAALRAAATSNKVQRKLKFGAPLEFTVEERLDEGQLIAVPDPKLVSDFEVLDEAAHDR